MQIEVLIEREKAREKGHAKKNRTKSQQTQFSLLSTN